MKRLDNIGFIGAGKVGFTLGKYFIKHGAGLSGYYSKNASSAKDAAEFTGSRQYGRLEELVASSDVLFLTVPDNSIRLVWDELLACGVNLSGKLICHASGSLSSEIFNEAGQCEVTALSLHPLFAISDKYRSFEQLHKAVFTIEGEPGEWRDTMRNFIEGCGNTVELIAAKDKPLYHAAAVVASNFLVGLSYLSSSLLEYCGFSEESAKRALLPLMEGSLKNVISQGTITALTGPVERNDCETVRKHIRALSEMEKNKVEQAGAKEEPVLNSQEAVLLYQSMTRLLMEIGHSKHKETDYRLMEDIVKLRT